MRPSDLDYNLDIATIFIMLIQAKAGIY